MRREYNNSEGKVTRIEQNAIYIDNIRFFTETFESQCIISASQARVGDKVIFNTNSRTGEIIFLRMKNPYYKGTVARPHSSRSRYREDPRDPDEVHDMEAVYGHSFEGI